MGLSVYWRSHKSYPGWLPSQRSPACLHCLWLSRAVWFATVNLLLSCEPEMDLVCVKYLCSQLQVYRQEIHDGNLLPSLNKQAGRNIPHYGYHWPPAFLKELWTRWHQHITRFKYGYDFQVHSSSGSTPFSLFSTPQPLSSAILEVSLLISTDISSPVPPSSIEMFNR